MTTAALTLTITQAGLARFTAAQVDGDIDLAISSVGLTDADFVVAPTLDVLPGEFRRLQTVSGEAVGDNIVHMVIRDDEPVGYTAKGFGLFLDDGTLFAVYGQPTLLFEKSPVTTFLSAIDIAFPTGDVSSLTFGDANFLNPPATTDRMGVVELATETETRVGTDQHRVPSVAVLASVVAAWLDERLGATAPTAWAKSLLAAASAAAARVVLGIKGAALKDEGSGNGLDADTVDGRQADYFLPAENYTAADVLAKIKSVDGAGSGLDADTLDGLDSNAFVRVTDANLNGNGYIVWSNGFKECWGSVQLQGESVTNVQLPVEHHVFCVPVGSGSRVNADEMNIGIIGPSTGVPTNFSIRNGSPEAVMFFWHTKGV